MDIREYSYVLAVVEYGNVSKAAEKLYISQPSLSAYIKSLEQRLGIVFFEPGGKTRLTPEGELYIEYARQIMTLNNNLHRQLEDFKNLKRGLVRLGVAYTRATIVLPVILTAIAKQCPDIQVEIREANSRELEMALAMQELDFAILNYPFHGEELEYTELYEEAFVLVVPKGHPICTAAIPRDDSPYDWIDIRLAAKEPFVLLRQGQRLRQIADELFLKADIHPNIICETRSAFTTHNLTAMGHGLSFALDTFFANNSQSETAIFSVGEPCISTKLVIAQKSGRALSPAARAVMSIIQEVV